MPIAGAAIGLASALASTMKQQADAAASLTHSLEAERAASLDALSLMQSEGKQQCSVLQQQIEEHQIELQQHRSHSNAKHHALHTTLSSCLWT